jgi:rhamnose utilization protein RhaD (predicted bifunctional aldolase and dehydrogenase)
MHKRLFRSMIDPDLLSGLARMSARIGADRLLVQGPGGNSSVKDAEELWVKASGQWLAEAEQRPIFVPMARAALCDGGGRPLDEAPASAVIADRNEAGLKPSIETMLHAIMPHRIVVHAHAVNAMAISVLADGETRAAERLAGLAWQWIPYHRPGAPLAQAVRRALTRRPADVLILRNHGVVVGADEFDAAEALLAQVERRLALPARDAPTPSGRIDGDEAFDHDELASAWACDPAAADVLTRHVLVPDQVVFLGGPIPLWPADETPSAAAARAERETGVSPALLLRPGVGAVAARSRTAATEAMIEGLIEVARRLPAGAAIHGLSAHDIALLANWEAEHYRRNIDAVRQ